MLHKGDVLPVGKCPEHQRSNQGTCHEEGLRHLIQTAVVTNQVKLYGKTMGKKKRKKEGHRQIKEPAAGFQTKNYLQIQKTHTITN